MNSRSSCRRLLLLHPSLPKINLDAILARLDANQKQEQRKESSSRLAIRWLSKSVSLPCALAWADVGEEGKSGVYADQIGAAASAAVVRQVQSREWVAGRVGVCASV